ncbi:putative small s protein [Rosellinia necatrix]|uniref:Putative small s protein n=1 Tax=Rosellinia necatrix TaxID=77044 RepID=A0A1W2TF12_ROSNE|nr:putative small s protein [Rosellinia necatrix]
MDAAGLAITLAGTVLTLVVFSSDFVGDVKQIRRQGATDRNLDLSIVVKSLEKTTAILNEQLAAITSNGAGGERALDPGEEELKGLSLRAAAIGCELAQKLKKIATDDKSSWKTIKAAALGMWKDAEIKETEKRLGSIKEAIQFRILVGLRTRVNESQDVDNSRMLAKLEEVAKHQAASKEDTKRMLEALNDADEIGRGRHKELVEQGDRLLDAINAISISRSPSPFPPSWVVTSSGDEESRAAAEQVVLGSLWYPTMQDREETISEAYTNTFRWIFEDPKSTGKPWDSFVDFLKTDTSNFWITGKPGCGKSTLMKFINQSPNTHTFLQQWAGERELVQVSYYFYYHGSEYQKSEIGLVRSILHSVLDRRRGLIPVAFRNRFLAACEKRRLEDPSLPEAKRALKNLILHNPNLCFFLSIDGLDEFDPAVSLTHVQGLIDFTNFLGGYKNVKILVSSRSLPEFERGYEGRPFLRTHDLTQEDIRRYASEKLMNDTRMKHLAKKDPIETDRLLQSIVESSLGVFLWVRLVTESLVLGLTNGDSISGLRSRLRGIPSDLHDLYKTILSKVDTEYKSETARLLYFVLHMQADGHQLTLLDLWFAENSNDEMVRTTRVEPIDDDEVRERVQGIEARLKSRCLGLIETVPTTVIDSHTGWKSYYPNSLVYDVSTPERGMTARFLHRSVSDFLFRSDIWNEFLGQYLSSSFSVALSFLRSAILIIKTCRFTSTTWLLCPSLSSIAWERAKFAELETRESHSNLVHELDSAMQGMVPLLHLFATNDKIFQKQALPSLDSHWSIWCWHILLMTDLRRNKALWPLQDVGHGSLMTVAVQYGLDHYIQSEILRSGKDVLNKAGFPLLGYALIPANKYSRTTGSWEPFPTTVKLLFEEGCSPNVLHNDATLWEWFLWMMAGFDGNIPVGVTPIWPWVFDKYIPILGYLLLAGAEPNALMALPYRGDDVDANAFVAKWTSPWIPGSLYREGGTVCTVLSALTQAQELASNVAVSDSMWSSHFERVNEEIQETIKILEARCAKKQEWRDKSSIDRIIRGVYRRINDKGLYTPLETGSEASSIAIAPQSIAPSETGSETSDHSVLPDFDAPLETAGETSGLPALPTPRRTVLLATTRRRLRKVAGWVRTMWMGKHK